MIDAIDGDVFEAMRAEFGRAGLALAEVSTERAASRLSLDVRAIVLSPPSKPTKIVAERGAAFAVPNDDVVVGLSAAVGIEEMQDCDDKDALAKLVVDRLLDGSGLKSER